MLLKTGGRRGDSRNLRHFATRAEAMAASVPVDVDLLEAHARLLGHDLAALLAGRPHDLDQACAHVVAGLEDRVAYTVRATVTGVIGDSGMYCPARLLLTTGATRPRALVSAAEYATAMQSREVVRIVPRETVSHGEWCMATCLGLLNDGRLPPFLHDGRNEDGVFAALLARGDGAALFGHLPYGVVHDSGRQAAYDRTAPLSATETRLADIILALLPKAHRDASSWPSRSQSSLRRFGQELMELGAAPLADFMDVCCQAVAHWRISQINAATAAATLPESAHWRAGLHDYLQTFLASGAEPDFFLPIECRDAESVEMGFARAQTHVHTCGELIAGWEEVWQAADEIEVAVCAAASY